MSNIGCVVVDSLQCPTPLTTETFIYNQAYNRYDTAMSEIEISEKTCPRCGETKPVTDFSVDRKRPDGRNFYCRECCNEYAKKRREEHKNDPKYIYRSIKARQKNYHKTDQDYAKPFELEEDWFVDWYNGQELKCGYCDIPNEYCDLVSSEFAINGKQLSIDCMDNDKGYVADNIILACHRCNATKNVLFTHDEMKYIGQQFIKPKWKRIVSEKIGKI